MAKLNLNSKPGESQAPLSPDDLVLNLIATLEDMREALDSIDYSLDVLKQNSDMDMVAKGLLTEMDIKERDDEDEDEDEDDE